jgi:hypothetical protein
VESDGLCSLAKGELLLDPTNEYRLTKGDPLEALEFAVNFRIAGGDMSTGEVGVALFEEDRETFRFALNGVEPRISITGSGSSFPVPENVRLAQYHQLRIVKWDGTALCYFDDVYLGEFPVTNAKTKAAIFCKGIGAAFEMVRLTAL